MTDTNTRRNAKTTKHVCFFPLKKERTLKRTFFITAIWKAHDIVSSKYQVCIRLSASRLWYATESGNTEILKGLLSIVTRPSITLTL